MLGGEVHWGSPETLSDVTHPSPRFLFAVVLVCLNKRTTHYFLIIVALQMALTEMWSIESYIILSNFFLF